MSEVRVQESWDPANKGLCAEATLPILLLSTVISTAHSVFQHRAHSWRYIYPHEAGQQHIVSRFCAAGTYIGAFSVAVVHPKGCRGLAFRGGAGSPTSEYRTVY